MYATVSRRGGEYANILPIETVHDDVRGGMVDDEGEGGGWVEGEPFCEGFRSECCVDCGEEFIGNISKSSQCKGIRCCHDPYCLERFVVSSINHHHHLQFDTRLFTYKR
jgi:hypothetical protein